LTFFQLWVHIGMIKKSPAAENFRLMSLSGIVHKLRLVLKIMHPDPRAPFVLHILSWKLCSFPSRIAVCLLLLRCHVILFSFLFC
jgi:hypothetical protein